MTRFVTPTGLPASACRRSLGRLLRSLLASTALASASLVAAGMPQSAVAQSLPAGGTVAAGSVTINQAAPNRLTIDQSSATAITNWQSFSIGAGSSVAVVQPSTSAAMLARVTGGTNSTIAGSLSATGQLVLVNPNGISITPGGAVNAGSGFVATTLSISDGDFLAGKRNFTGNGASGAVSNAGTISVGRGGYAALIGGAVDNSGTISAPMGKVGLGSGEVATLDFSGDGFLQVGVPTRAAGTGALVSNSGKIRAKGGMVEIKAAAARDAARQAINMSGVVAARSVSGRDGNIRLDGGAGAVAVTGRLNAASRDGKGGRIIVTGRDIRLAGATLDASGKTGGGTVRVGGDRQGKGTLARAETVSIDAASTIKADAASTGRGGDVVVWSDVRTAFAGLISAKGGALSGHGGEVEVSGKALLDYTGYTDLSAANGRFGTLLLDPYNVTISSGANSNASGFTATGNDSVISVATLQAALAGANVSISTGAGGTQTGNITVADAISWTAGTSLTLTAATNIIINAPITFGGATGAGLVLNAPNDLAVNAPIQVRGIGDVAVTTNNMMFGLTGSGFPTGNGFTGALTYRSSTGAALTSGAGGTLIINGKAYTLLYSLSDVEILTGQNFGEGYFALARDLDAGGRTYNDALIGNTQSDTFYGTLEGLGHVISNLTIVSRVLAPIGLIGRLGRFGAAGNGTDGVVRNIGLVGGSVTAGGIGFESTEGTGGLVGGNNGGTIINTYNTGTVSGEFRVGGLVGVNANGRIISSYATGAVSAVAGPNAHHSIGGLVGQNITDFNQNLGFATVTNSYATGTVNGDSYVGGLIGNSEGGLGSVVTDVYATGAVHGAGNYVGGLVGSHIGSLTNAYATGAVSGADYVGGVAGRYQGASAFSTDFQYATGPVSGRNFVGGLIGYNTTGLRGAYATGAVIGAGDNVGGLFGTNEGFLESVYATGAVSSTGNTVGGLAGQNQGRLTGAYATGEVRGADRVGGLVGLNAGQVTDAYATGAVTGANHVGGLVGLGYWALQGIDGTVTRAYATGAVSGATNTGGLVGFARVSATITNSYWDTQTSGRSTSSGGGTGLTTAQIRNPFTFIDGGWNFTSTWATPRAGGTPALRSLTSAPVYNNYVRLSGNISTTYGDAVGTSGITLGGIGAGNVSIGWGSAISATTNAGVYGYGGSNVVALTYSTGVAGDYYVDYGTGALTIDRRALTVTADSQSRIYGNANPALTYTVGGLVNGDALSGALATSATMASNVGSYAITQGSLANANYAISYAGANLSVGQRAIIVTADAKSRTYGDANPALTYAVGGLGLVNGDTLSGALATSATTASNVGSYAITQGSLAASANYALTYAGAGLTVTQRAIIVTADAKSRTYGDANPALTYAVGGLGLVNGDTLSGALATSATTASNVGSNAITQGSLAASANYALTYAGANLSVGQRAIIVTADAKSRTYGDVNPALTYAVGGLGLVNGDTLSGALATSATTASNVGSYAITQGSLAASANYALTYAGANLSVGQRAIIVTADAKSRTYGDANPALTYAVGGLGLVNGDTLSGALATSATMASNVGSNAITQGSLAASANYALTYAGAGLTVTQRAIIVTADPQSPIYGNGDPALTFTSGGHGLVNGDTPSGALATSATTASNVGDYTIVQGALAASSNDALAYANVLTISPGASGGAGSGGIVGGSTTTATGPSLASGIFGGMLASAPPGPIPTGSAPSDGTSAGGFGGFTSPGYDTPLTCVAGRACPVP